MLIVAVSNIDEFKAIEAEFNNQDNYYDKYGNDYIEKDEVPDYENNEEV